MRCTAALIALLAAVLLSGCARQRAMQARIDTLEAHVAELEAKPAAWLVEMTQAQVSTETERPWWDPGLFWFPLADRPWNAYPFIHSETADTFFGIHTGPGRYSSVMLATVYFDYIDICVEYLSVGPAYIDNLNQAHPHRDPQMRKFIFQETPEAPFDFGTRYYNSPVSATWHHYGQWMFRSLNDPEYQDADQSIFATITLPASVFEVGSNDYAPRHEMGTFRLPEDR